MQGETYRKRRTTGKEPDEEQNRKSGTRDGDTEKDKDRETGIRTDTDI